MSKLFYPKKNLTNHLKKEYEKLTGDKDEEGFNDFLHEILDSFLDAINKKSKSRLDNENF
jgi:hypothetical protein